MSLKIGFGIEIKFMISLLRFILKIDKAICQQKRVIDKPLRTKPFPVNSPKSIFFKSWSTLKSLYTFGSKEIDGWLVSLSKATVKVSGNKAKIMESFKVVVCKAEGFIRYKLLNLVAG